MDCVRFGDQDRDGLCFQIGQNSAEAAGERRRKPFKRLIEEQDASTGH